MNEYELEGHEEIEGEARKYANGTHVTVPTSWRGADVKLIRLSEPGDE